MARLDPDNDPLIERYQALGEGYWALIDRPDKHAVERLLGYPMPPMDDPPAGHVEFGRLRGAIWMELLRVVRQLSDKGYSVYKLTDYRGILSRSEVQRLVYDAARSTPAGIASGWKISAWIDDINSKIGALNRSGETEAAEGLRKAAMTFLNKWLRVTVSSEWRSTGGYRPPEFDDEDRQVWGDARKWVQLRIRNLGVEPTPPSWLAELRNRRGESPG